MSKEKMIRMYIKLPHAKYKQGSVVEVSLEEARGLARSGGLVADKKLEELAKKNDAKDKKESKKPVVKEIKEEKPVKEEKAKVESKEEKKEIKSSAKKEK